LKEPGEDIQTTAIREAKEETGLDVELGDLVGDYTILDEGGVELITASVFTAQIVGGELQPNEREIEELGWFDPENLPEPPTDVAPVAIPDGVRGLRGMKRSFITHDP
jgi:8-oxo-dGTP pyrophosphatase MutT (NUDIX family)